jgi:hypothetical protein
VADSRNERIAERAVRDLTDVMTGRHLTAHVVHINGVYHQNPECPEVEPGDDLLPRRGDLVEVDLFTLTRTSECGYCRNYFRDHGPGTKELVRLAEGAIATARVLRGGSDKGAAINLLRKNWLVPSEFVREALSALQDVSEEPRSETFSLVERGGPVNKEQENRLVRGLWHWEDGWSVVEYNGQDVWRKSVVLGTETKDKARTTARVYAEVTRPMFKDQTEAWRAAKCIA